MNKWKMEKGDTYQYPYELQQSPNVLPRQVCPISPAQLPSVETGFPVPCAGAGFATDTGNVGSEGTAFAGATFTGVGSVDGFSSDGTPLFGVKKVVRLTLGSGGVV